MPGSMTLHRIAPRSAAGLGVLRRMRRGGERLAAAAVQQGHQETEGSVAESISAQRARVEPLFMELSDALLAIVVHGERALRLPAAAQEAVRGIDRDLLALIASYCFEKRAHLRAEARAVKARQAERRSLRRRLLGGAAFLAAGMALGAWLMVRFAPAGWGP